MTTEELRSRQLELFTAMIDGKQIQRQFDNGVFLEDLWKSVDVCDAATFLFDELSIKQIRIRPEPRKVWVGWHGSGQCLVVNEEGKRFYEGQWSRVKWQLVEELV